MPLVVQRPIPPTEARAYRALEWWLEAIVRADGPPLALPRSTRITGQVIPANAGYVIT